MEAFPWCAVLVFLPRKVTFAFSMTCQSAILYMDLTFEPLLFQRPRACTKTTTTTRSASSATVAAWICPGQTRSELADSRIRYATVFIHSYKVVLERMSSQNFFAPEGLGWWHSLRGGIIFTYQLTVNEPLLAKCEKYRLLHVSDGRLLYKNDIRVKRKTIPFRPKARMW